MPGAPSPEQMQELEDMRRLLTPPLVDLKPRPSATQTPTESPKKES